MGRTCLLLLVAAIACGGQPATAEKDIPPNRAAVMAGSLTPAIVRVATVQKLDAAIPAAADLEAAVAEDVAATAADLVAELDDSAETEAVAGLAIPGARPAPREVLWTVDQPQTVNDLAIKWGVRTEHLVELNPKLANRGTVQTGERYLVFRENPAEPTKSIGAPNRGRLANGLPLPEGEYWEFRPSRRRSYGTPITIESLVSAFEAYGEAYPDADPIRIGEISAKTGGRAHPHKSHRTGRDVDIGYVLRDPPEEGWRHATAKDFDVARNWTFIKALAATGQVQQIFVSSSLIELLRKHAAKEMTDEEMAQFFWMKDGGPQQTPLLKHQNGHRDHMHVRFACNDDNKHCRSKSVEKRRKNKKKRG